MKIQKDLMLLDNWSMVFSETEKLVTQDCFIVLGVIRALERCLVLMVPFLLSL